MNPLEEAISPQVRVLQIIIGALVSGVMVFGILVTTVLTEHLDQEKVAEAAEAEGFEAEALEEPAPVLQYLGYGLAATAIFMFNLVGPLVRNQALKQIPTPLEEHLDQTLGAYQTGAIISGAILEGAAFFNLIAYMIEGAIGNLATAVILVMGLASLFPTVSGVANWIEDAIRNRTESDSYNIT